MASGPVQAVLDRLNGVTRRGKGWVARCPAHDDGNPSLKIDEGADGRALLRCYAGCSVEHICTAVDLTVRELMPPEDADPFNPKKAGHTRHLEIVGNTAVKADPSPALPPKWEWPETARYDYTDADGVLLFTVVRRELDGRKTFQQEQPDGTRGLKGIRDRPLYRLPAVLSAVRSGEVVLLVEGEKDAETAHELGLVATTNMGGANGWQDHYVRDLTNANVVVVPDQDTPGREWASKVADSLVGIAAQVRVVVLPGVPEKGDLTDWVAAGGTAEALHGMILRAAPHHTGDPIPDAKPSRFALYKASDLESLPPLRWLVDDVVPVDALAALVGPSGIGKTFVTLDMVCAIATGSPWCGHSTGTGAPVLYIAAEGTAGLRARLVAWCTRHGVAMQDLPVWFICETVNLMDSDDPLHVIRSMTSMPVPPALVVIDTLHRAMPGGDENSAKDVGVVVAAADRIRRTAGCSVMLVHHTKKDADVERGSTALRGACDSLLLLKDEDGTLSLECEKQKDAAGFAPLTLQLTEAHGSLVVESATGPTPGGQVADPANLTTRQRQVLKALADASTSQGLAATPWHRCAQVPERTFYRASKALVEAGLVAEADRTGRYMVTMTGKSALAVTAISPAISTAISQNGVAVTAQKPQGDIAPPKGGGVYHPSVGGAGGQDGSEGSGRSHTRSRGSSVRRVGSSGLGAPPAHVLVERPMDEDEPWWNK